MAMTSASHSHRLRLLQAHAEMDQGMLAASSMTLSNCSEEDHETIFALATLDFREGRYVKAMETYTIAKQVVGSDQLMLTYYIALCHYQLSGYDASLELIEEIIDDSKGNDEDQCNNESFLVEALNLKGAILFMTKNADAAKNAMTQFTENLDAVTIHNDAIINIAEDPSIGIQKLEFLLSKQPFPPETLSNLLTLYTSHGQDHLAAVLFETNKCLAQELLPPDLYIYFDAVMMSLSCPDDAILLLEAQIANHAPNARAARRGISEAAIVASVRPATTSRPTASARPSTAAERKGNRALAVATKKFDAVLDDRLMPMLCLQAKLYWDKREYSRAEQALKNHADFCSDHDAWLINMGHVLFSQQKFEASIEHYEQLMQRHEADLLKLPAVTLANLCVAYVLVGRNEAAEGLIRTVEKKEQLQTALGKGKDQAHSCIINLCIGSLYCQKKNYAFGIERICKSVEPVEKNICPDTWFYVKRSFLAFALLLANQSIPIKDDFLRDILCFFAEVEANGKHIPIESNSAPATIASEGQQLKNIFIKICA
jgi:tetratricopeptide repeat protein 30